MRHGVAAPRLWGHQPPQGFPSCFVNLLVRPHLTRTHAIGHLMAHHNSDRCHGEARQRQRVAGTGPAEGPAVPCLVVMAKVLPEHDLELPAAKDEDYGPCTCGERSSPSQPQSLH